MPGLKVRAFFVSEVHILAESSTFSHRDPNETIRT